MWDWKRTIGGSSGWYQWNEKMGGCHLIREDSSSAKCQLPCVYVKNKKKCGRAGRGCGGTLRYVYNIGLFFNYSPRTMINEQCRVWGSSIRINREQKQRWDGVGGQQEIDTIAVDNKNPRNHGWPSVGIDLRVSYSGILKQKSYDGVVWRAVN